MLSHSDRLDRAIEDGSPLRISPIVEWSPGRGSPWYPLQPLSGSHTQDRTSQTRWTFTGAFAKTVPVGEGGLHPYGCRARISVSVSLLRSSPEIIPAGQYVITAATETRTSIQLTGASYEQDVIDSILPVPRTLPEGFGYTFRTQAEKLITEAVPDAYFAWDDRLAYDRAMPQLQADSDRWGTISGKQDASSITGALGAEAYCNAFGAFTFAPVPTFTDAPVWQIRDGQALIEPSAAYDRDNVRNLVVVTGSPGDGSVAVGPAYAWDNEPTSLTYAGPDPLHSPALAGPYGVKPVRYDSPLVTDDYQAYTAAKALLSDYIGLHKTVAFITRYHPCLEAGDVTAVERLDHRMEPHLLDTIAYDWATGKATCAARTTKTEVGSA